MSSTAADQTQRNFIFRILSVWFVELPGRRCGRPLTLQKSEAIIVPHRMIWSWYTGRWWVGCYIWYSEEGSGRGRSPPRPLLAVPNVTAHPSTASVPITVLLYNTAFITVFLFYSFCIFFCSLYFVYFLYFIIIAALCVLINGWNGWIMVRCCAVLMWSLKC